MRKWIRVSAGKGEIRVETRQSVECRGEETGSAGEEVEGGRWVLV